MHKHIYVQLIPDHTMPEIHELLESILELPDVRRAIYNAVLLHREKEDLSIGLIPSECHAD